MKKNSVSLIFSVILISLLLVLSGCDGPLSFSKLLQSGGHSVQKLAASQASVSYEINKIQPFPLWWLYKKMGRDPKFYKSKISENSFSESEYEQLILHAYTTPKTEQAYYFKLAAIVALKHSLYPSLSNSTERPSYPQLRELVYAKDFLKEVFPYDKEIIGLIPELLENYGELARLSVELNPESFESLSLEFKLKNPSVRALFYASETYDNEFQHLAIQYANKSLKKEFLSKNGLLMKSLPNEDRNNLSLAYAALLQNELAIDDVSYKVSNTIQKIGLEGIQTPNKRLKVKYYEFLGWAQEKKRTIQSKIVTFLEPTFTQIESVWLPELKKWPVVGKLVEKQWPNDQVFGNLVVTFKLPQRDDTSGKFVQPIASVMRNRSEIEAIEAIKERRLLNLWKIADLGFGKSILIAYFKPTEKNYLASVIYKKGRTYLFDDYSAFHSFDGSSIWRVDDYGKFGPDQLSVVKVEFNQSNQMEMTLQWVGPYSTNLYRIVEEEGGLKKNFIDYKKIEGLL